MDKAEEALAEIAQSYNVFVRLNDREADVSALALRVEID
jgi:hypothetical protein